MLKLIFLGTGSAVPSPTRACTSHLLLETESNNMIMVDCGSCVARNFFPYLHYWNCPLDIFITHMHPDHWVGLLEILPVFALLGRTEMVSVWCNFQTSRMLEKIFNTPMYSKMPFKLIVNYMKEGDEWRKNLKKHEVKLRCQEADHSVPTLAFRFDFKQVRNRPRERGPLAQFSIGFGADSRPTEILNSFLYKVDYLIWEATYLHSLQHLAIKSKHSTSFEAGKFAQEAQVKMMFMNHISYHTDPVLLLAEAQESFPTVLIPHDGKVIGIHELGGWNAQESTGLEAMLDKAIEKYTNQWPPPSSL